MSITFNEWRTMILLLNIRFPSNIDFVRRFCLELIKKRKLNQNKEEQNIRSRVKQDYLVDLKAEEVTTM